MGGGGGNECSNSRKNYIIKNESVFLSVKRIKACGINNGVLDGNLRRDVKLNLNK